MTFQIIGGGITCWLIIDERGFTVLPQSIWVGALIVYYPGLIRINRAATIST